MIIILIIMMIMMMMMMMMMMTTMLGKQPVGKQKSRNTLRKKDGLLLSKKFCC